MKFGAAEDHQGRKTMMAKIATSSLMVDSTASAEQLSLGAAWAVESDSASPTIICGPSSQCPENGKAFKTVDTACLSKETIALHVL